MVSGWTLVKGMRISVLSHQRPPYLEKQGVVYGDPIGQNALPVRQLAILTAMAKKSIAV